MYACVCVFVCVYIYAWVCWWGGKGERREQMVHFLLQNVNIQNVGCLFVSCRHQEETCKKTPTQGKKYILLVRLGFDWSYLLDVICKFHIDYFLFFLTAKVAMKTTPVHFTFTVNVNPFLKCLFPKLVKHTLSLILFGFSFCQLQ